MQRFIVNVKELWSSLAYCIQLWSV